MLVRADFCKTINSMATSMFKLKHFEDDSLLLLGQKCNNANKFNYFNNLEARTSGGLKMVFTAVLTPAEEGGFVAFNPETGTTTQGETVQEAVANLKEATTLYLEEFPMTVTVHPLVTTFDVGHA